MEKRIATWSYWLGIACLLITIAWKAGNAFGLWRALPPARPKSHIGRCTTAVFCFS